MVGKGSIHTKPTNQPKYFLINTRVRLLRPSNPFESQKQRPFYIILLLIASFSYQRQQTVFPRSLSNPKSPQVSRILLSILADLHNTVVRMIPILLLISNSTSLFLKTLRTVPNATTFFFFLLFWEFCAITSAEGFSLIFKWQQVSSNLQDSTQYPVDLHHAVVWKVSSHSLISKSVNLSTNHLVTSQSVPITTGITVTFTFHCIFVLKQGVGTNI